MEIAIIILAAGTLLFWIVFALDMLVNGGRMRRLCDLPDAPVESWPRVSIIVPACNEERKIETAMKTLLSLDYPNYEIIAINDRSTDGTGALLDRLAAQHGVLRVSHVEELPPGWLGKNHALDTGARKASGEWLLFTDADVHFHPDALRKAMAYALQSRRAHIAVIPEAVMPTLALRLFVASFSIYFSMYARPWKAADAKNRRYCGIGAFNLIRADAYRLSGGHARIAMRVDDDMMLGKVIKDKGFRQEVLFGEGMLKVEWYSSLGEVVRGLEKNSFSGVNYNLFLLIAATFGQLLGSAWPFIAIFVMGGWPRLLYGATVVVIILLSALVAPTARAPRWAGVAFGPLTLFFLYILWNAAIKTLSHDGITWRGTQYPLKALRESRV